MAAKGTIGGKIVLEGEKQYREALKAIKSDQAELRSEMKLCQTTFQGNQNSLEALNKKYEILTKQIDSQSQKIEVYQKAITDYTDKQEKAAGKISDLKKELEKAEEEMRALSESSDDTTQAAENQAKVIEDLKKKLEDAEKNYDSAGQKIISYQTNLNNAQADMVSMEKELEKTGQYMKEAENSTDQCATSIDEYGNETEDATNKTSIFGDVLKANLTSEVIIDGVKKLAKGIKQVAEAATEAGSEFEASMSQVAATMGMTAEEINSGSEDYKKLADAAKECGKATKYSASEAGEALNYLALAGYDVNKSVETLPKVLDLAAAGGMDLAYASDLVTDSMAALNMETKDLDKYIDEMAKTSQKSNTNIAQLGEATLVCAGTVTMTGQELETMNAELGILANNGLKGAEGGTKLRNILLSLAAPTEKAESAIEDLNLSITDSQGNMRDLNDIMYDMNAALSEMSSMEKTQIINKIFNKTDISAVNYLLKGSGEEFANLTRELQGCQGSAKDMADTMNNNLKGKVTILKSALEGLGISAYEVFDEDMKIAVEGATNAVGRLQKSIDQGDLGVSLNKMSKALGEFCENALEIGEEALPGVIDGFTWILENGDMVVSCLAAIMAGQIEMAVAPKIINACNAAWEAYQLVTQGAATWQEVLNVSMAANPAGLLLTAITALTAGVAAYVLINKDNLVTMDEVTKATREQVEEAKALNEQYVSSVSNRAAERQSLETEAVNCKKLVGELKDLSTKISLTSQEQARMQMIVEQLNQAMPELTLAIDEQTGKLNMSVKALEDNVDAMMALARAEAAREDMAEIAKDQYEAEKLLADLQEQMEAQTAKVTEAQEDYNAAMKKANDLYGEQTELYGTLGMTEANALSQAQKAQEELQSQINATQESIEGFTSEYEQTMNYISDTEAQAVATQATSELGNAAEAAGGQMVTMSSEMRDALDEMQSDLTEKLTSGMDIFSEFTEQAAVSKEKLLENMQSQIDGMKNWADNLEELADRGISQGLIAKLASLGPEGAAYVQAFIDMTDEELQKANDMYAESFTLPGEVSERLMTSYMEAGGMIIESFTGGIDENKENATEKVNELGEEIIDTFETVLKINSPSKASEEDAGFFVSGFALGVTENKKNAILTVDTFGGEIIQTFQDKLKDSVFYDIGKNVTAGIQSGIESGKSGMIQSVKEMCTEIVNAAKKELEINSPSKKFDYMGDMSAKGYIGGWQREMADINAIIAESLPDTSMNNIMIGGNSITNKESISRSTTVYQDIKIMTPAKNLIETTREFREAQKEAAKEW